MKKHLYCYEDRCWYVLEDDCLVAGNPPAEGLEWTKVEHLGICGSEPPKIVEISMRNPDTVSTIDLIWIVALIGIIGFVGIALIRYL